MFGGGAFQFGGKSKKSNNTGATGNVESNLSNGTDNRVAVFDGTTGKVIKESPATLNPNGDLTGVKSVDIGNGFKLETPGYAALKYNGFLAIAFNAGIIDFNSAHANFGYIFRTLGGTRTLINGANGNWDFGGQQDRQAIIGIEPSTTSKSQMRFIEGADRMNTPQKGGLSYVNGALEFYDGTTYHNLLRGSVWIPVSNISELKAALSSGTPSSTKYIVLTSLIGNISNETFNIVGANEVYGGTPFGNTGSVLVITGDVVFDGYGSLSLRANVVIDRDSVFTVNNNSLINIETLHSPNIQGYPGPFPFTSTLTVNSSVPISYENLESNPTLSNLVLVGDINERFWANTNKNKGGGSETVSYVFAHPNFVGNNSIMSPTGDVGGRVTAIPIPFDIEITDISVSADQTTGGTTMGCDIRALATSSSGLATQHNNTSGTLVSSPSAAVGGTGNRFDAKVDFNLGTPVTITQGNMLLVVFKTTDFNTYGAVVTIKGNKV